MSLRNNAARFVAAARARADRTVCGLVMLIAPASVGAQQEYFNLDAGRSTRVEDAVPTGRYALQLLWGGVRLDQLTGGVRRWRTEPKVSYGVLPFTELELRVPLVRSVGPGPGRVATGAGGVGIGVLHALNVETARLPAFAVAAEFLLPAGAPFGAPRTTYSVKALVTRTTRIARFHLNASAGSYSVRSAAPTDTSPPTCTIVFVGGTCANGQPVPVPIDFPCLSAPPETSNPETDHHASRADTPPSVATALAIPVSPAPTAFVAGGAPRSASRGRRWLVGVGADRTWPLRSLLVSGDIYAEHFERLYRLTDWTAEFGARRQLTPRLVLDFGVARHFAGTVLSSSAGVGMTWATSTRGIFDEDD